MLRSLLVLSLLAFGAFGLAEKAEACNGRGCSYYSWTGSGDCAEFTPSGNFIRWVSTDVCRRQAGGSFIQWTGSGDCAEFTPSGNFIKWVSTDSCRRNQGSFYDWTGSGDCAEFTPSGNFIKWVSTDSCRRECGVVRKR